MDNKNLVYRIIEYGIDKKSFSMLQMKEDLKLTDDDQNYILTIWLRGGTADSNPNHIIVSYQSDKDCRILPAAVFHYNDYLEIVEARKSAQHAKKLSWYAIWISSCLAVIQIVIGYFQLR